MNTIDRGRLERAKMLHVEQVGPRQYKVGEHYVDLEGETPCHCADALLTNPAPSACKHQLAALLKEGWRP